MTYNLFKELEKLSQKAKEKDEDGFLLYSKEEIEKEKIEVIASTPVPTDKDELIDMYLVCKQHINEVQGVGEAWASMLNNVVMKLKIAYPSDSATIDILNREEKESKKEARRIEREEAERAAKEAQKAAETEARQLELEAEEKKRKQILIFTPLYIGGLILLSLLLGFLMK